MLTFTSISTGITALFYFFTGATVLYSWIKRKHYLVGYFSIFLLAFGFQQMFFSLASGPISLDVKVNAWLWAIAHVFMFVSVSYFIRIPLRIRFPRAEKTVFKIAIAYAIIGLAVLFVNAPQVTSRLEENGVYLFKVPTISVITIVIFTTLSMLFSAITFLGAFFEYKGKIAYRIRGLVLGAGMVVYLTSGPAHNLISTPRGTFFVDALLIFAGLLFAAGIYLPKLMGAEGENLSKDN